MQEQSKIKRRYLYMAWGMSVGLTLTGPGNVYRLNQKYDYKFHSKPQYTYTHNLPERIQNFKIKRVTAVPISKCLSGSGAASVFLTLLDQWSNSGRKTCKAEVLPMNFKDKQRKSKLRLKFSTSDQLADIISLSKFLQTSKSRLLIRESRIMIATAYYPGAECTGVFADGLTSTGKKAKFGIVAVDPKIIPLGTKLYIRGYGFAEAADVGGAIKGNRIDLCFNTYREAIKFGRKKVDVFILPFCKKIF